MARERVEKHLAITDDELAAMPWVEALRRGSHPPVNARTWAPDRWLAPALERRIRRAVDGDARAALLASLDHFEQRGARPRLAASALVGSLALCVSVLAIMGIPDAALLEENVGIPGGSFRVVFVFYLCAFVVLSMVVVTVEQRHVREARHTFCVTAEVRRVLADVDAAAPLAAPLAAPRPSLREAVMRWLARDR